MQKKSVLLIFAMILVISVFLVACGGNKVNESANQNPKENQKENQKEKTSDEKVDLVWITHSPETEEERELYQVDIVDAFEAAHPNVTVKWVEAQDSYALIRQQLAAGAGPDIISTGGPTFLGEYVNSGYLLPLDPYVEQYKWNERFYDWALEAGKIGDKVYGLPGSFETLLVWYNKGMFAENGWEIPTTYDELVALSEAAQAKKIMPFAFGASDFRTVNEWWLSSVYNAYVGPKELKEVLQGNVSFESALMKQATETYVDMWQKGYINNKQSHAISMEDAWGLFNNNQAAMKLEGTWALSRLQNDPPPFDTGFFEMPSWRDGVDANLPIGLGDAIGINAKTKHPELAAQLLDFIYSTTRAEKLTKLGQFQPMNGLDVAGVEGIDPLVVQVYDRMNGMLNEGNAGYVSWTYFPPSALSYLWNNIDAVFLEQMSVNEYLKGTQEAAAKDKEKNMLFNFAD